MREVSRTNFDMFYKEFDISEYLVGTEQDKAVLNILGETGLTLIYEEIDDALLGLHEIDAIELPQILFGNDSDQAEAA